MLKAKKFFKVLGITLILIVVLLIVALLFLAKPLAMSVYNQNFGVRFSTYQPLAWQIEDFPDLLREKHTFTSNNNQLLTGYKYYKENTETKGLLVIAHGFGGGGHCSYMNIAEYFASNNYVVFAYDATGNDESQGEAVGGLPQGIIDLDYALKYVKSVPEFQNLPIVLWGHSWGGYSVGSVLKLHPDVKSAVIVSGFNESLDMLESEGRNIAGDAIDFVLPLFKKHEEKTFGEYASMSILESLAETDATIMIIHSTDDFMIPVEQSYDRYFEKYGDNERFTFIRYEDRGHNYIFCSTNRNEYLEEYNKEADKYKETVGEITEEIRAAYYKEHFNKHKAYELDSSLMSQMLILYNESIK